MDNLSRLYVLMLTPLLALSLAGSAQNVILSNPSACQLRIPLGDNTCPETNASVNQPDIIRIQVSGQSGTALGTDVYLREVRLILSHTWMSDVGITLKSPGGRTVLLTANLGGSNDHIGNPADPFCTEYAIFSSGACTPISEGTPPYLDRAYRPLENLLNLNDNTTNPNGIWELQFCDDVPNDVGLLQFVELVFEPSVCLPIQERLLVNVDTTTAVLFWSPTPVLDCSSFLLEYGPPGFIPGNGQNPGEGVVVVPTCPPYALSGLQPATTYEVYIRRFCALSNAYSDNGCPLVLTTGCQPAPTTLVESFDDYTSCTPLCGTVCPITGGLWRNVAYDELDWLIHSGSTPTPNTGPDADINGGGKYAYIETTGLSCINGKTAILESNCIELRKMGTTDCHLSFNYHMNGVHVNTLQLEVSADGGFSWSTLWQRTGNQQSGWKKQYISLHDFVDSSILKFRFTGTTGGGSFGDIGLDQITFHGSLDRGPGDYRYYADADGDGFGNPNREIQSCFPLTITGFTTLSGDCNDLDPNINPNQPETPCNGLDENCNGPDDDLQLPPPQASNISVCSGDSVLLCAQQAFGGILLWYSSPEGDDSFVDFGDCITPDLPPNTSPLPVVHTFYVEEFSPPCISAERAVITVTVYPVPDPAPVAGVVICPGESLNLAEIDVTDNRYTGGTLSFHTSYPADAANELDTDTLSPGQESTIYYKLTGPGGCSAEGSFDIGLHPLPVLQFSPADSFSLCREATQTVSITPIGGAGGYTYLWASGHQSASLTVSAAATPGALSLYPLRVTDAAGCSITDTLKIRTTNSIDSIQRAVQHVSDCGLSDGRVFVNPLNGLPPFHYTWSGDNGLTGAASGIDGGYVIDHLPQGIYRVTITDSANPPCPSVLRQIIVNGPNAVVSPPQVNGVTCNNAANGSICLNVSGSGIQYQWSTGATTACVDGLAGGSYAVTVSAGPCQTVLQELIVPEPDSLSIIPSIRGVTCAGRTDGQIEMAIFGGTPPYNFQWSNGMSGPNIYGLGAGSYTVVIADARGCLLNRNFDITAPAPLQISIDDITMPSCAGYNDGLIKVTASGGTMPYQYSWSSGNSTPLLFQAAAGQYHITLTDLNACTQVSSITLSEPSPLDVHTAYVSQPVCPGADDGIIVAEATGGLPPYQFSWSNGLTGNAIQHAAPGNYSLTVTDANHCPQAVTHIELQPQSVVGLQSLISPPTCAGRQDGSITLQPTGTPPFSIQWQDLANGYLSRADVGVGQYALTITDDKGCTMDTTLTVSAQQVFDIQSTIITPACHDGDDGLINITLLQGGTMPFAFAWSNGRTSEDLIGINAGDYTLTITDALGCRYESVPLTVINPSMLHMELISVGSVLCHGDNNGFVEVQVSGGSPPYTNPNLYGIPAGQYFIQSIDSRSCPVNLTVQVPEPPPMTLSVTYTASQDCISGGESRLEVSISGGIPPYRILWSNGDTTAIIMDAPAGEYSLSVQDANGCIKTLGGIKVNARPDPIQINSFEATDVSCFGRQDGQLSVSISGGSAAYRYHFSTNTIIHTSENSVTIGNLSPGSNYRVTITDVNTGCILVSGMESITQPQPLIYFRNSISNVSCYSQLNGGIEATTRGGTWPYQYRWIDQAGLIVGDNEDLIGVGPGTYSGQVTDTNGCTVSLNNQLVGTISSPVVAVDSLLLIHQISCSGTAAGMIRVVVQGGAPPYQYHWSHGATTAQVSGLSAGLYELTVTDALQCPTIFGPFEITAPPALFAGINATPPDSSGSNGAVTAIVSGGSPPYTYLWNTGDTTASVVMLSAGAYLLTVTDATGCTATSSAVLVNSLEHPDKAPLKLYPVPSATLLFVEGEFAPGDQFAIRNMNGLLLRQELIFALSSDKLQIDVRQLPPGLYIFEYIRNNQYISRTKFLVTR
jgi:hypothetical protein